MKKIYNKTVVDECEVTTYSHRSLRGALCIGDSLSMTTSSKTPPTLASMIEGRALRAFQNLLKKLSVALQCQNVVIRRHSCSD